MNAAQRYGSALDEPALATIERLAGVLITTFYLIGLWVWLDVPVPMPPFGQWTMPLAGLGLLAGWVALMTRNFARMPVGARWVIALGLLAGVVLAAAWGLLALRWGSLGDAALWGCAVIAGGHQFARAIPWPRRGTPHE